MWWIKEQTAFVLVFFYFHSTPEVTRTRGGGGGGALRELKRFLGSLKVPAEFLKDGRGRLGHGFIQSAVYRGGGAHLQDEGQDGGAQRRVVAELLQVTAVLPFGPHRHLDEAHQGEEGHWQALSHQREAEP